MHALFNFEFIARHKACNDSIMSDRNINNYIQNMSHFTRSLAVTLATKRVDLQLHS